MAIGRSAKDILIHIKGDDKDFQGALKRSDTSMGSFASSMKSYAPVVGAAFLAMGTAAVAYSVKVAMTHEQLDRGFRNLAASQGRNADEYLRKIKEVSHGTVSEVEIMQKANQAMLLGIDLDTITKMMEGAAIIAQSTGQDVGYMFESLALGVGRQSRMLLDNLGIIVKVEEANKAYAESIGKSVSELTDAETKTAFLNATMEGLNERTGALGGFTEDATTEMQKLEASVSDAAVAFGAELLPSLTDVIGELNRAGESSDTLATKLGKLTAIPFEISVASLRLEPLEKEMEMIKNLEAAGMLSTEGEKRKHKVLIEMMQIQNGEYENRLSYIDDYTSAQDKIIETEDNLYFTQLRKMGATEQFLNTLRTELEIHNQINDAVGTQISMQEQLAAKLKESLPSRSASFGSGTTMSAATARSIYGEKVPSNVKISPNITSSTRSGV